MLAGGIARTCNGHVPGVMGPVNMLMGATADTCVGAAQETVTDSSVRRKLCVRICGCTSADGVHANGGSSDGRAAATPSERDTLPNGSSHADKGGAEDEHRRVIERTFGTQVDAPQGVQVITDMWAFKRRQAVFASSK